MAWRPKGDGARDADPERDWAAELIDWLSDKDPDIRHYVAGLINWDNGEDVVAWIVSRPDCDLATACETFWKTDPIHLTRTRRPGEEVAPEEGGIFDIVVARANEGLYPRGGLAARVDGLDTIVSRYREAVAALPPGVGPWPVPEAYLKPMPGREPVVPAQLLAENDPRLRNCLNGLGTTILSAGEERWRERQRLVRRYVGPPAASLVQRWAGYGLIGLGVALLLAWGFGRLFF